MPRKVLPKQLSFVLSSNADLDTIDQDKLAKAKDMDFKFSKIKDGVKKTKTQAEKQELEST